jgi:catechol 2,3-dioxygenase-like lactoylglutathione lyase family enzyme
MSIKLNHTIVHARDKAESARFYSEIIGLPAPKKFGPFLEVDTENEVTLAILETDEEFPAQHYAFLVSEDEFDQSFNRIQARGLSYWADPHMTRKGQINHNDGGRGVYFEDPSGNILELLTRPYGSGE